MAERSHGAPYPVPAYGAIGDTFGWFRLVKCQTDGDGIGLSFGVGRGSFIMISTMNPIVAPTEKHRTRLRRQIRSEFRSRHEAELTGSGFWRRIILLLKQELEVSKELNRRLPPRAFYGVSSS